MDTLEEINNKVKEFQKIRFGKPGILILDQQTWNEFITELNLTERKKIEATGCYKELRLFICIPVELDKGEKQQIIYLSS